MDVVFAAVVLAAEEEEGVVADWGGEEGRGALEVDAEEGGWGQAEGGGDGAAETVAYDAVVCGAQAGGGGEGEGAELALEELGGVELREHELDVGDAGVDCFGDSLVPGGEGGEVGERDGAAVVDCV